MGAGSVGAAPKAIDTIVKTPNILLEHKIHTLITD